MSNQIRAILAIRIDAKSLTDQQRGELFDTFTEYVADEFKANRHAPSKQRIVFLLETALSWVKGNR